MNNDIQVWNLFKTLAGRDQTKWHDYLTTEKNAEYSATKFYKIGGRGPPDLTDRGIDLPEQIPYIILL